MKSCVVVLSALQVLLFQLSTSCFIFLKAGPAKIGYLNAYLQSKKIIAKP